MDRPIVYPSEQGRSTDFLFGQRAAMIGMSKLAEAMFGTGTFTTGLSVGPNTPAALNVIVQPGQVFMTAPVDAAAYGSLAADTAHSILKQGLLMDAATIACPAPTSAGYSINYLIEATYQDQDTNNLVLPYFNSANPSQPLSGQNNSGAPQATERQGVCVVQAKAGAAAATGTQTTPALDSGYVGLAVVTVAYGQSTITIGNISGYISPVIPSGGAINNSLSAILNKNVAGSIDVTLDPLGEAVYPIINLTGALTGNISVIVPAASRKWVFANNTTGTFAVTIKTPTGTGIIAIQGTAISLYCDGTNVYAETGGGASSVTNGFTKADSTTPAFAKAAGTGVQAISIKAGTYVSVNGVSVSFPAATAVVLPALSAGTDYAIYACADGTCRADASFAAPSGYTTANSRMIGGFHFGLVASGTTIASGSFATTGNGMIWSQPNVDAIAGINQYSIWDLKFRPKCNPAGMVLVDGQTWVDIYLCSTATDANGTSKYNTNIASGTVLPLIPSAFGGNGVTTYPTLNWWVANELARSAGKRMMKESEFVIAAFGVTENQSIDTTSSTYPTTLRNPGYTSKFGIEQASGHQWTWGEESNFFSEVASPAYAWHDVNGNTGAAGAGRGQDNTAGTYGLSRVILGGSRNGGSLAGSRASSWNDYPWNSGWYISLRAACDHMQSV